MKPSRLLLLLLVPVLFVHHGCGDSESDRAMSEACKATCQWKCGALDGCDCGGCDPGFECGDDNVCKVEGYCIADCGGKVCGDDGCGGSCGVCDKDLVCDAGQCIATGCVPQCDGRECGGDGCGGSCGECDTGAACIGGSCVGVPCQPDCVDKECGDDGCEGSCGACDDGLSCTTDTCINGYCIPEPDEGVCVIGDQCIAEGAADPDDPCRTCIPSEAQWVWSDAADGTSCGAGKVCVEGTCCDPAVACHDKECGDDGCGGSCGECTAFAGSFCIDKGICDCATACDGKDCGDDACGGSCGTCDEGWTCQDGLCVEGPCEADCAGKVCGDDGCGGSCGDCACGETCTEGLCVFGACVGKQCGDDGCGGSCGDCGCGETCQAGLCIFSACLGKNCGDDGCGGSCGECDCGEVCATGVCASVLCVGVECGDDGCGGSCGTCSCGESCVGGLCVFEACGDKECGDDGCGGSCGECPVDWSCQAGVCVDGPCEPDCTGKDCGDDGCGSSCGTCGCGETCDSGVCTFHGCDGETCGDDGCGGSCGTCEDGWLCEDGACVEQLCGNGQVDSGETCDKAITGGAAGECVTACPADEECSYFDLVGSVDECTAECVQTTITDIGPEDGCCPEGATPLTDADCPPECGNGLLELGESCEEGIEITDTCASLGKGVGLVTCSDECAIDTSGCSSYGPLEYEKIPNIQFSDDFYDLAWHPDGETALIITADEQLLEYTASTKSLSLVATLDAYGLSRVSYQPDGDFAYVVGYKDTAPRLFKYDPVSGTVVQDSLITQSGVRLVSAKFHDDGRCLIAGYKDNGSSYIGYVYLVEPPYEAVASTQAYASGAGLSDIMWAEPSMMVLDGAEYAVMSEGVNGTGSMSYVLPIDSIVSNNWKLSFGNAGRASWRPGGLFGVVAATSTKKVYVYEEGIWSDVSVPDICYSTHSVAWNKSGTRALLTARMCLSKGSVVELRLQPGQTSITQATQLDQSIAGFDQAPWLASSNTYIYQAEWRPASECEEGLMVASDNGTSWSPTFGLLIRFYDYNDPDCP